MSRRTNLACVLALLLSSVWFDGVPVKGMRARIQILADRTGGRLSEIRRLGDLYRLYAEVAADLRTLYTITYQPSGKRSRGARFGSKLTVPT